MNLQITKAYAIIFGLPLPAILGTVALQFHSLSDRPIIFKFLDWIIFLPISIVVPGAILGSLIKNNKSNDDTIKKNNNNAILMAALYMVVSIVFSLLLLNQGLGGSN